MGIVDADTKTALLVAQAAVRTLNVMRQIQSFYASPPAEPGNKTLGVVAFDDPIFKFVGSEKDPPLLQRAQATWQLAHIYYDNEVNATHRGYGTTVGVKNVSYIKGFNQAAADQLAAAADMIKAGFPDIAAKIEAVADEAQHGSGHQTKATPAAYAKIVAWNDARAAMDESIASGKDIVPGAYYERLLKLADLATPPGVAPSMVLPSARTTPRHHTPDKKASP